MSGYIEYQRSILSDPVRNQAFAQALRQCIRPGMHVLDIGAGSGFLAFLALQYGAGRVTAIEREPEAVALARKLAKRNGLKNCTFIEASSFDVRQIQPVDLIVSETIGNFAYEENIIELLSDARRFLRPGGLMLPQSIRQFAVPLASPRLRSMIATWGEIGYEINWADAWEKGAQNMYVRTIAPSDCYQGQEAMQQWDAVDLQKKSPLSQRQGTVEWVIDEPVTLDGIGLFWEVTLLDGMTLSTSPWASLTHWQQIYLPVFRPLPCLKGDRLTLTIHSDSRRSVHINVAWKVVLHRSGKVIDSQALDMKRG